MMILLPLLWSLLATHSLSEDQQLLGKIREGSLHCLGNCVGCHSTLSSLPRERLTAAASHTDLSSASSEEVSAWLAAPEVCDLLLLYPVDFKREAWSLASLPALDYLGFRGAQHDSRQVVESCNALQLLSVLAWQGALRAANHCVKLKEDERHGCLSEVSSQVLGSLLRRWRTKGTRMAAGGEAGPSIDLVIGKNETLSLLGAFNLRAEAAFVQAEEKIAQQDSGKFSIVGSTEAVDRTLAELATELGRTARILVEHVRTAWGLKQLTLEISQVYPAIESQFPTFRIQSGMYGRHWDTLERLLDGLEKQQQSKKLRMAELGVACGPIGLHLLARFPELQYFGADPTINDDVWAAYQPYGARAKLFATTSEEMHTSLIEEPPMDLVFIDGPHTYANVRNDLHLWEKRVRRGGIVAGHDFTIRHPPLLWAVTEYRLSHDGSYVNLGMDGVWWWQVE